MNLLANTLLLLTTALYKVRASNEGIESVMPWESIAQQPSVDGRSNDVLSILGPFTRPWRAFMAWVEVYPAPGMQVHFQLAFVVLIRILMCVRMLTTQKHFA